MAFKCKECGDIDSREHNGKELNLCLYCYVKNKPKKTKTLRVNKILHLKCRCCGIRFDAKDYHSTCSRLCNMVYYKTCKQSSLYSKCKYCGNEFYSSGSKAKYCSKSCRTIGAKISAIDKKLHKIKGLTETSDTKVYGFGNFNQYKEVGYGKR